MTSTTNALDFLWRDDLRTNLHRPEAPAQDLAPNLALHPAALTRVGVIPSCARVAIPPAIPAAVPTGIRAAILVPGGLSANLHRVQLASAVVVLRTSVERTSGWASLVARATTPLAPRRAAAGGVRGKGRIHRVDAATSREVGLRERPLAVRLNTDATSANAIAVRLVKAATPLVARVVRLARDAPLPGWLTLSRAQTLVAAVLIGRRPRASDCRRCYLAPGWLPAVRLRIGSVPAASLSTVNLPCSASAYPPQTNYAWTAV